MPKPIRLYRYALSGHAHRVQLMLSLLRLPYDLVDVNLAAGEHKGVSLPRPQRLRPGAGDRG